VIVSLRRTLSAAHSTPKRGSPLANCSGG